MSVVFEKADLEGIDRNMFPNAPKAGDRATVTLNEDRRCFIGWESLAKTLLAAWCMVRQDKTDPDVPVGEQQKQLDVERPGKKRVEVTSDSDINALLAHTLDV